ncbi:hypothetical protein [Paraliomyxa miuraensis]|uniref:hypothetical protein n=1 Tax=Paraliomyxa miuraensis TaxID=376150 RepID=UPI00224FEC78|nr:hypothetical protein [Paraliomyxa miuraensis]MCX4247258.1 hypothetical protein [Paraliomyxa miuraensis]
MLRASSLLVTLSLAVAFLPTSAPATTLIPESSPAPPAAHDPATTTPPATHDDHPEDVLCYWACMALCLASGKQHDGCTDICAHTCFTVVAPPEPTCESNPNTC